MPPSQHPARAVCGWCCPSPPGDIPAPSGCAPLLLVLCFTNAFNPLGSVWKRIPFLSSVSLPLKLTPPESPFIPLYLHFHLFFGGCGGVNLSFAVWGLLKCCCSGYLRLKSNPCALRIHSHVPHRGHTGGCCGTSQPRGFALMFTPEALIPWGAGNSETGLRKDVLWPRRRALWGDEINACLL